MKEIEKKLDYVFTNKALLKTALTHSSYANERKRGSVESNERLEFLGDSILGMVVAEYLYNNYPYMKEGWMTKVRSELVCEQSLAGVAYALNLGDHMCLGKGELQSGGRKRPSLLADAVEAIIAAVTLDGGIDGARNIIQKYILSRTEEVAYRDNDYKTLVQEQVQKVSGRTCAYRLIKECGPDHMKEFTVEMLINDKQVGMGCGRTKKEAEQAAAAAAMKCVDSWS